MTSAASDLLTQQYVGAQDQVANGAVRLVAGYWAATVLAGEEGDGIIDIRAAAEQWLDRSVRAVMSTRRTSARLANAYYGRNRRLELPGEKPIKIPTVPEIDRKAIERSLWTVGPRMVVDRGRDVADLRSDQRISQISGAVVRHTLNGGRDVIKAARESDQLAVGTYRIAKPDCCSFCGMLASRGVVFDEESFDESDARFVGPGTSKVHDRCRCHERVVYTGKPGDHPEETLPFLEAWKSRPSALPGESELNAFRRYWDSRRAA